MAPDSSTLPGSLEDPPLIPIGFVGLQFLLERGAFLQTVVTEEECKWFFQAHQAGKLPEWIGGSNQIITWRLKSSLIIGLHTIPQQPPQQQGPHGQVWRGGSGLN